MQKWSLVRSFSAVDGEVASVHAQAKRNGVQFSEFDAAAGEFLGRRDHPLAHHPLKRIGIDVPGEQTEAKQAENAKQQKEFPENAAALGGRRLAGLLIRFFGRFPDRSRSDLRSGLGQRLLLSGTGFGEPGYGLPERRLASHPDSSSFIFFSASKSLIRPKTSVSGVALLPAFFISGSN